MKSPTQLKANWTKAFKPLVGRKIVNVRWFTDKETNAAGWHRSPFVIQLDDGTLLWPSSDDEGNDAGAMFLQPSPALRQLKVPDVAPVI